MVIYEVNLNIDAEIYSQFESWLKGHAKEILQFPGFIQASIIKQDQATTSGREHLTVQYLLENRDALDKYFTDLAPKMREQGINLFKDKFSAERKIFDVKDIIQK